ncbi:MAG TPA: ABC transporter ATP-binding protein [Myxococcota bacterium]|nr:ABC transporter ATP-binding protein [Myxococcota bacterium]
MAAPAYALRDVTFSYDEGGPTVLGPLALELASGAFTGVIGPNGAGKSTLLRLLAGTARPRRGEVLLDGAPLAALDRAAAARRIAFLPAITQVAFAFSALEVVLMGRAPHLARIALESAEDLRAAHAAMARAGAAGLEARAVDSLSSGERQRVAIARALVQGTRVFLLDEPTAHLDIAHQSAACALFRDEARAGATVVAALHDLNLAALYCDRLVLLVAGVVAADGAPAAVLSDAAALRRAYGDAIHVGRHPVEDAPAVLPLRV